jgi:hypothetical protein
VDSRDDERVSVLQASFRLSGGQESCCGFAAISAKLHLRQQKGHDAMTLNKFRRFLYALSRYLGDAQAVTSKRKGSVSRRVGRRIAGRITGKGLGKLFK